MWLGGGNFQCCGVDLSRGRFGLVHAGETTESGGKMVGYRWWKRDVQGLVRRGVQWVVEAVSNDGFGCFFVGVYAIV